MKTVFTPCGTYVPGESARAGFVLGHFKLDSINTSTGDIRAGCHTIKRAELEAFGELLEVQS